MSKQKQELIPKETVIIGKKDLGVYQASNGDNCGKR